MIDAQQLAKKVRETVRLLGPFCAAAKFADLADRPEITAEITECHGHAIAFARLAQRERTSA